MNINTSVSAYSYSPSSLNKTSQAKSSKNDSAELVAAAPQTAQKTATQETKSATSVQDLPDEAYAVPTWQAGYYEDITYRTVLGTPGNYVTPESAGFAAGSQADNVEYGDLLQKHVQEVYEKNGLMNAGDRYKALSMVKGLDERLHKEFTDSVSQDPRMMELMGKLGVSLA